WWWSSSSRPRPPPCAGGCHEWAAGRIDGDDVIAVARPSPTLAAAARLAGGQRDRRRGVLGPGAFLGATAAAARRCRGVLREAVLPPGLVAVRQGAGRHDRVGADG